MALARVETRVRYIGVCPEHPHWAVASGLPFEAVERLVSEHNDAEHGEEMESLS